MHMVSMCIDCVVYMRSVYRHFIGYFSLAAVSVVHACTALVITGEDMEQGERGVDALWNFDGSHAC